MSSGKLSTRHVRIASIGTCCAIAVHLMAVSLSGGLGIIARRPGRQATGSFVPSTSAGKSRIRYESTFLDFTSMWAMGVDARSIPPRRKNVPLVSWSDQAVARVRAEWLHIQWSTPCDRAMYVYPHSWGIASQMRDYSDAAFIALAFGRPLRVVKGAPKPRWCEEDSWLECFFEPLAGPSCELGRNQLASVKRFRPQTLKNGSAVPAARRVFSGPDVLHMAYDAQFTFILDDTSYFPRRMWKRMIDDGLVCFHDHVDHRIDPNRLMAIAPRLFHAMSVSALRTMLTSVIFRPRWHILAEARLKIKHSNIQNNTCIALHLRWTDKKTDGGVAANLRRNVEHLPHALDRIGERIRHLPSCVIVLTDDDQRAIPMLAAKIGTKFEIQPLTRMSFMFGPTSAGYDAYAQVGHNYFAQQAAAWPHERGRAFDYFRSTIVDALAASHAAKFFIGMGSSGLSQLVSQLMGFHMRADANAFAVWQEDVIASMEGF